MKCGRCARTFHRTFMSEPEATRTKIDLDALASMACRTAREGTRGSRLPTISTAKNDSARSVLTRKLFCLPVSRLLGDSVSEVGIMT